jgi:hypothetical protein
VELVILGVEVVHRSSISRLVGRLIYLLPYLLHFIYFTIFGFYSIYRC